MDNDELERARKLLPKTGNAEDSKAADKVVPEVEALRSRMARIGQDIDAFNEAKKQVEALIDTIASSVAIANQFKGYYEQIDKKIEQVLRAIDEDKNAVLVQRSLSDLQNDVRRLQLMRSGGGGASEFAIWGYGTRTLTGGDWALEATLTAIKGVGWSAETLKATYDLIAGLNNVSTANVLAQVQAELGAFSSRTNYKTWLAALGLPDTADKPLYTVLVTDRLDSAVYGLDALHTHLAAIPTTPTLQATWTDAKAGYLTGNVALEASVQTVDGVVDAIKVETDQLPNWVFNVPYALDPVVDSIASTDETALTACTFTPVWRTGATVVRVILHAYLHAASQAAGGHKIGLTLQYSRDAGAYADLVDLTASPPLVLPDLDEAMGTFAIAIDVTDEFTTSNVVYGFKWLVDSDNAGDVHYSSNFEVIITQSM